MHIVKSLFLLFAPNEWPQSFNLYSPPPPLSFLSNATALTSHSLRFPLSHSLTHRGTIEHAKMVPPSSSCSSKSTLLLLASLLLCLMIPCSFSQSPPAGNQSHFFTLMKASFPGESLSHWDIRGGLGDSFSFCNFTGIACDGLGRVVEFDVASRSLSGRFPPDICSYLPELRALRLGFNGFHGSFLNSLVNCSVLEELNLTHVYLPGPIPDLSPLQSLR